MTWYVNILNPNNRNVVKREKEDLLQNKCTETGAYVQKIILN